MTHVMSGVKGAEDSKPETGLEEQLVAQLTKRLVGSALEGEVTDHLGCDKRDPAGRGTGNSRNRPWTRAGCGRTPVTAAATSSCSSTAMPTRWTTSATLTTPLSNWVNGVWRPKP
ncbi:hypothetical protein ACIOD2_44335 [Amycolatopsis sp. NPDC088138]|uniref:hypothetical protein n=1 Tax=Amycolatopsis sp. NPDC088138 TaxID=3363938 RepID=UPI0037FE4945